MSSLSCWVDKEANRAGNEGLERHRAEVRAFTLPLVGQDLLVTTTSPH